LQAEQLRRACGEAPQSADFADALRLVLHADQAQRLTAAQLLRHSWLQQS